MPDSKVRLLIGTRKGGFIAESDRKRKKWKIFPPFQLGREVFHIRADARHPGHLYACVNSWFSGPMVMKSSNYGRTWTEVGTPMMPISKQRPPAFNPDHPENPPPKRAVANLWHIEPGPSNEPKTMFLGIDPYSLYRSDDAGASWDPVPGLNDHPTKDQWGPGAGGPCLHTIIVDPTRPKRMYAGISAAGLFRSDDGGETWKPKNGGIASLFQPDVFPEVGHCVHKVVLDPSNPDIIYRQDHAGIYVSRDAGDKFVRVGKPLPYDFGFVVAAPKHTPGKAFFVPLEPEARVASAKDGLQVYAWDEKKRKWAASLRGIPFPGEMGTHREGLAADSMDPAGVYLGTTTGQLIFSSDGAKSWDQIPYRFPSIHSVSVSEPAP